MPHLLIVTAPFYEHITSELLAGARAELERAGHTYEVTEVPGAFEIPGAIRFAMGTGAYDGFIALGCVIRGETTHYDYVCSESARGLQDLAVHFGAAIGYGILTVESEAQALARARVTEGNKGAAAAEACLRMIALKHQFGAS